MHMTDDPQDALDLWHADATQWIVTDGIAYAVCAEREALHALESTRWAMTSPEMLARTIEA